MATPHHPADRSDPANLEVIFLGGLFLPSQLPEIYSRSRGVVQNAADALQKALLHGLAQTHPDRVSVVNLPFVGSYPQGYRTAWFAACEEVLAPGVPVHGKSFLNVRFVRFLSRFVAALQGLRDTSFKTENPIIVVYSAHLPFLAAARLIKLFRPRTRLCVFLPDLPEFMGEGGLRYRALKRVESALFHRLVRRFDSFVLLTDAMGERIRIPVERRIIVEGIYDPHLEHSAPPPAVADDAKATFLYTGTLASRYGIVDLLTAFADCPVPDAQLWICGDGDAREMVEAMAANDPRVRYFGQVPRERALALQREATVLVNPRRPEGEFTRYSFPSKTMEYLASGRPVIMHCLPGLPPEYLEHLVLPPTPDAKGLAASMHAVATQTAEWRRARGAAGRAFILANKSPLAQVTRIRQHWLRLGRSSGDDAPGADELRPCSG